MPSRTQARAEDVYAAQAESRAKPKIENALLISGSALGIGSVGLGSIVGLSFVFPPFGTLITAASVIAMGATAAGFGIATLACLGVRAVLVYKREHQDPVKNNVDEAATRLLDNVDEGYDPDPVSEALERARARKEAENITLPIHIITERIISSQGTPLSLSKSITEAASVRRELSSNVLPQSPPAPMTPMAAAFKAPSIPSVQQTIISPLATTPAPLNSIQRPKPFVLPTIAHQSSPLSDEGRRNSF
jgi:hypothetical protein